MSSISPKLAVNIASLSVQAERSAANSARRASHFVLRLLLGLLEKLRLLRQLRDQPVTLLGQLVAVRLLGAQCGVGFSQLLLQGGVGFCKRRRKGHQQSVKKDEVARKIRPECSAVDPNLGDY